MAVNLGNFTINHDKPKLSVFWNSSLIHAISTTPIQSFRIKPWAQSQDSSQTRQPTVYTACGYLKPLANRRVAVT